MPLPLFLAAWLLIHFGMGSEAGDSAAAPRPHGVRRSDWPALGASLVVAGAAAVLLTPLSWPLQERVGDFWMGFLFLPVLLAFGLVLLWAVVHAARALRRHPVAALSPLGVLVAAYLLVGTSVLWDVVMRAEFGRRLWGRTQVLAMVDAGQLPVDRGGRIRNTTALALPPGYRHLTWDEGRIWV